MRDVAMFVTIIIGVTMIVATIIFYGNKFTSLEQATIESVNSLTVELQLLELIE